MAVCTIRTDRLRDEPRRRVAPNSFEGGDLEELMVRYQKADADAVREFVGKLSPKLLALFSKSKLTRPYAEDLLRECWIRIHKARNTYRPGTPVLSWVYAIARYTLIDGQLRLHGNVLLPRR